MDMAQALGGNMEQLLETFFEWAWSLIYGIGDLWAWLTTPVSILGYTIAPIWLVGASMITIGALRAIIGLI